MRKSCLEPTATEAALLKIISAYPEGIKAETLVCKLKKRESTIHKNLYQLSVKGLAVYRYSHMQCFYAAKSNASSNHNWHAHSNFS